MFALDLIRHAGISRQQRQLYLVRRPLQRRPYPVPGLHDPPNPLRGLGVAAVRQRLCQILQQVVRLDANAVPVGTGGGGPLAAAPSDSIILVIAGVAIVAALLPARGEHGGLPRYDSKAASLALHRIVQLLGREWQGQQGPAVEGGAVQGVQAQVRDEQQGVRVRQDVVVGVPGDYSGVGGDGEVRQGQSFWQRRVADPPQHAHADAAAGDARKLQVGEPAKGARQLDKVARAQGAPVHGRRSEPSQHQSARRPIHKSGQLGVADLAGSQMRRYGADHHLIRRDGPWELDLRRDQPHPRLERLAGRARLDGGLARRRRPDSCCKRPPAYQASAGRLILWQTQLRPQVPPLGTRRRQVDEMQERPLGNVAGGGDPASPDLLRGQA